MKHSLGAIRRAACVALVAVLLAMTALPALAVQKGDILQVNSDYTRLRAQPKPGAKVLTKLNKGAKVVYMGEQSGWVKLKLNDGKVGYMYKTFLSQFISAKVGKVYRSRLSGRLAVRSKPSKKDGKIKFDVKNTTKMVLLERKGSWGLVRVVSNGKTGYVRLQYLKPAK